MATTKKPAAKSATKESTAKQKVMDNLPTMKPEAADAQHPDVHPGRHSNDGMQEANTAGVVEDASTGEAPVSAGMVLIGANAPSNHGAQPGSARMSGEVASKQDYVYSQEQAMSLPEVESGTPVKMPTEAQRDADHKERVEEEKKRIREANETAKPEAKTDLATADSIPKRMPVVAFKEPVSRRTMLVVKTSNGLAKMPAPNYKGVEAASA